MKHCMTCHCLLLIIMDVSTNAQEVTCSAGHLINVKILFGHPSTFSPYKPGHILLFQCTDGNMTMFGQRAIECLSNGSWDNPYPKCAGRCGPPPNVTNGDTIEMTKKEYFSSENVEYRCFSKYVLDDSPSYSSHMTCQYGEWIGKINCLKPCMVTVEEMDEKGITLRWGPKHKIFSEHKEYIAFTCQKGKMIGSSRQMCNDGVMTLPMCV